MQIIIGDKQLTAIFESKVGENETQKEVLFREVFVELRNFYIQLGKTPTTAKASHELQEYLGMDTKELIEKLIDADLLRRKTSVVETPKEVTANGKSKVAIAITYSRPTANFKKKIMDFINKYKRN